MYKIVTVDGKVIDTTNSQMTAMIIANKFANENYTYCKVYRGNTLIAIFH